MKNITAYIVGSIIASLALIPPIYFSVDAPSAYWPWWIIIAGFLGFYTLFIKTDFIVKVVAIGGFLNCFFSADPYVSFTSYISLVAGCYFYILCRSIKDYKPVFKILQCLLVFTAFMFIVQFFGQDRLLNFGRVRNFSGDYCFGIIGQHMQSGSFSVILSAALLPFSMINLGFPFIVSTICNSAGSFICAIIGLFTFLIEGRDKKHVFKSIGFLVLIFIAWMILSGKISENMSNSGGRLGVWLSSLEMSFKHPIAGWGMSTYKGIFPALGGIKTIPWKTAHNCWIQIIFEFGYTGFLIASIYFSGLFIRLIKLTRRRAKRDMAYKCLAGLMMIAVNMMFHFPTRMIQTILIIIFFLAYCEGVTDGRVKIKSS